MFDRNAKALAAALGLAIVVLGAIFYWDESSLRSRVSILEEQLRRNAEMNQHQIQQGREDMAVVAANVEVLQKRDGVTTQELQQSRQATDELRRGQDKVRQDAAQIQKEISRQAVKSETNAGQLAAVNAEFTKKVDAVQKESDSKVSGVSAEVKTVAKKLDGYGQELQDTRNSLGSEIRKTSDELAEIKNRNQRNVHPLSLAKGAAAIKVGGIPIRLTYVDEKNKLYSIEILTERGTPLPQKWINVGIQYPILIGEDLLCEVVINSVTKNGAEGFLKTPLQSKSNAEIAHRGTE
jgi:hypothetical protein